MLDYAYAAPRCTLLPMLDAMLRLRHATYFRLLPCLCCHADVRFILFSLLIISCRR